MALSQQLVQKQTTKLVITQDLRQSIELLPLSNLELADKIQQELLENPLLEAAENADASDESPAETSNSDAIADLEGEDFRDDSGDFEKSERKNQFLQNAVTSQESLADHLLWQLRMSDTTEIDIQIGEIIVSAIDNKGFLDSPLEELFEGTKFELARAKKVLRLIYTLDPIGCGATSVQESLLVQTEVIRPDDLTTQMLVRDHFEDLEKLDYKKIEKNTGLTSDEIEKALQFIRSLEPYPGTLYSPTKSDYIVPDLAIIEVGDKLEVLINDDWIPGLKINESYRKILRGKDISSQADKDYMQSKLNSAQWLIKSIRQRRQTLYLVMKAIVDVQEQFLRSGQAHMQPLTLREIAETVNLHESTVSRITTNKYVQTKWGIYELKYFFNSALRSSDGYEMHSAKSIQDKIRLLVEKEEADKPLSDQEIADLVRKEGVVIARRTVAKYRKLLKILPADRRKKIRKLKS